MKTTRSLSKCAAFGLALGFALFLLHNTLSSIDFPRILYIPPDSLHWAEFDSLNPSVVWNFNLLDYGGDPDLYMSFVERNGLKAVLRPYWHYKLERYSLGQYLRYEAEQDFHMGDSLLGLPDPDEEGFYFFWHGETYDEVRGAYAADYPFGGASWKCDTDDFDAGVILYGPGDTIYDEETLWNWKHQSDWPEFNGNRNFKSIFRVMANAQNLADDDTIFSASIWYRQGSSPDSMLDEIYYTKASLEGTFYPYWKNLEFDYTVPDDTTLKGNFHIFHKLEWMDKCDFWVDWIEFMDMDNAYYLFYHDEEDNFLYRSDTLAAIVAECQAWEAEYGNTLYGWHQSDEPYRSAFMAPGVVNDTAKLVLEYPPLIPLNPNYQYKRPELFELYARPPIMYVDIYPFKGSTTTGDQVELDTLAAKLERAYQVSRDNDIPLYYAGQVHDWYNGSQWNQRNPRPSEIAAETFIALAHGAKGITYYKYLTAYYTSPPGSFIHGLVDTNYTHDGEVFAEKWQAVHDIFTQLDSIDNTLLSLQRDTAYCVYSNPAFQSTITNIYFEDDDEDYIEVGQFDSSGTDFLILVNRRTDHDRHITVETNLTGNYALRDIYTQEQFVSSTGNFEWIPFDSGEGRVFKFEQL